MTSHRCTVAFCVRDKTAHEHLCKEKAAGHRKIDMIALRVRRIIADRRPTMTSTERNARLTCLSESMLSRPGSTTETGPTKDCWPILSPECFGCDCATVDARKRARRYDLSMKIIFFIEHCQIKIDCNFKN